MSSRFIPPPCLIGVLMCAAMVHPAYATWSIIAINPRTAAIGVAAASCSGGVYGIQAVSPGIGAVIVQADSNDDARREAIRMLRAHASLDTILARMTDPTSGYSPQEQQYALLTWGTDEGPRNYTGSAVPAITGHVGGRHFSVQGNTLASDDVITRTAAALRKGDWPDDLAMAHALMRALAAGASAGGDRRCGKSASNTAFISLHRASDPSNAPWLTLSVNRIPPGTASGTAELDLLFKDWLRAGMHRPSTSIFVVPERHDVGALP